ncbi:hypothetical protein BJ944DRAFT_183470 [Cunninghamella echinulata]|nr:hypothetical protein BJ944DRAFT_183470 [Cunninghamella echinulata]
MFRFDNFRKNNSPNPLDNSAPVYGNDPLSADVNKGLDANNNNSFLQRIASSDTLFRPTPNKRPSTPNLHKSSSSSSLQSSQSFHIPIPINSWAMKAISQLKDNENNEYDDIIQLLLNGDLAVLLLPVSRPTHPSAHIDLEFIKDHVVVYPFSQDKSHVMTLSGVRGVFKNDQFVPIDISSEECDVSALLSKNESKKSSLDSFNLDISSITPDFPAYNILATHVPMKLSNEISIDTMLIQKPISKSDVSEWVRNKQISSSAVKSLQQTSAILNDPLVTKIEGFIKSYRQRPPKTMDIASTRWHDFFNDLQYSMEQNKATDIDDRLDKFESFMCLELYEKLFIASPNEENFQDEVLESRIAALNLLDLNLGHLGVTVDNSETESIDIMVKAAGSELQRLNEIPDAKGKLDALVKTHQIIVDAIEQFATKDKETTIDTNLEVVQEMQQAMSTVNDIEVTNQNTELPENKEAMQISVIDNNNNNNSKSNETINNKDDDKDETAFIEKHNESIDTKQETVDASPKISTASADVLLPLLIFTIVKSNPTNFVSNLKFIQRFRRPGQLVGQANYCLTNILAAVSFLETTNLVGLGLSVDKVHSNVTDLNAVEANRSIDIQIIHNQNNNSTGSGGLKLVSEVMDSSYKVFDGIGRLWQRNTTAEGDGTSETNISGGNNKQTGLSISPSELKELATSAVIGFGKSLKDSSREGREYTVPGFLEQRKAPIKPSTSTSSTSSNKTDSLQSFLQAPSQFIHSVQNKKANQQNHDGPIQKFLNVKSVDDLTIRDITELLADYKRLAAILKQSNVL